jgi:hypothetical protein
LVRSTTPANTLSVDATNKVAVPDTQKVDVNTLKTQAVTCGAAVTINPSVGAATIQPTVTEFEARTLAAADYVVVTDTIAGVTLCGTCTTNTDMRGTDSAALASVCTEARLSELDAATGGKMANQVDIIQTDTTTDIPTTLATIAGYLDTEIAAILADTNELQTDWANGGRLDLILDSASAPTAAAVADAVWDEALAGHAVAGSAGAALSAAGTAGDPWITALPGAYAAGSAGYLIGHMQSLGMGAITWTYTLTDADTTLPIDGAEIWISSDSAGSNIIASGTTDSSGIATFYLDAGTVYVWRKKSGYNFTNPDQETVS